MFIRELRVEGYGPLQNVSVSLETPVTIVFGPNEAGKSTLLRFIRSMLYGIPTRKDPVERGEPVFGGRHGGRMTVLTRDGRELMVERYADGSGRKTASGLRVRDGNGTELRWTQPEWERHALGGMSERLFRQLFAVSLDELHELLTLQGDEIGNFLYHAGLAGGSSLAEARRKLAAEMDKLYRPKGSNQEMNRLLSQMKETEAAIRQSRGGVALFQETSRELAHVRKRLEELDEEIPRLAEKAAEFRGALDARELWLQRQVLQADEMEWSLRLPDPAALPLPEEAAMEWTGLLRRRESVSERLGKAAGTVRERRKERETLRWDEDLLQHAAELEKLEAMREAASARLEESESMGSELRLLDDAVESLIHRLSADWQASDLQAFVGIAAEREPLRRLQQAWLEAGRTRERMEADAGRIRRQQEALRAEMESTRQAAADRSQHGLASGEDSPFGPFRPKSRETLQLAWNALEDEVRLLSRTHYDSMPPEGQTPAIQSGSRVSGRRGAARSGKAASSGAAAWFAASALGGAASLFLLAGAVFGSTLFGSVSASLAGAILMAAFTGLAVSAGLRRTGAARPTLATSEFQQAERVKEYRRRIDERLRELFADPAHAAEALFGGDSPVRTVTMSEDAWKRLRKAIQDRLTGMERSDRESARDSEWQRRLSELDREQEALQKDLERTVSRLDELNDEWMDWLRGYKLPPSLTPDSLPELIGLAEQGQVTLRRRARAEDRLRALTQFQASFRETAAALFAVYPPPASMEFDTALSVTWLYRRAAEERSVKEEAERIERALKEAETDEAEAKQAYLEAEAAIISAFRLAGAEDEDAYTHRLRIDERRRALSRERKEIELRLEAGRTLQSAASFYRLLESLDETALSVHHRQAEEAWQAADRERTDLLDRRGRLTQELERLRHEAESEDRLMKMAELESKLERLAERYTVLAIADRLLQDTKAIFEEERQPEVLRLASRYFAHMTGGAYARIAVPGDTPSILAETPDRRLTDSAFLSRGTQEQLYLAMRFALAEAASRDVPLPLLLDDLFVHFDERRLRQTVPVLEEISRTRQVILFTCHRHVAEAFRRDLPSARIMEWEARRVESRSEARGPGSLETANPG